MLLVIFAGGVISSAAAQDTPASAGVTLGAVVSPQAGVQAFDAPQTGFALFGKGDGAADAKMLSRQNDYVVIETFTQNGLLADKNWLRLAPVEDGRVSVDEVYWTEFTPEELKGLSVQAPIGMPGSQ